jgi:hypothetical protein
MQLVAGPITNAGLEVERLARVPYLCLGDVKGSRVYELDDAVLVPSLSLPLSLSFLSPLFLSLAVSLSLPHASRCPHRTRGSKAASTFLLLALSLMRTPHNRRCCVLIPALRSQSPNRQSITKRLLNFSKRFSTECSRGSRGVGGLARP